MNPNKQQKQRALVSAPSAEGERSGKCIICGKRKPLVCCECKASEYAEWKARAELLASDNRTMAKGVAIIVKENNELRTQVKKAEAEANEIGEANVRLAQNWHKAEGAFGVASRKAREAEAKLQEYAVTLGAERKDYHRLLAKSRCYEEMKAKLAETQKTIELVRGWGERNCSKGLYVRWGDLLRIIKRHEKKGGENIR